LKKVVLYTKAGCHLCENAKAVILSVRRSVAFELQEVDIARDEELFDLYKHDIPVVTIDGRQAFKHRVDAAALKEKLS
jgi:glutaredoxin